MNSPWKMRSGKVCPHAIEMTEQRVCLVCYSASNVAGAAFFKSPPSSHPHARAGAPLSLFPLSNGEGLKAGMLWHSGVSLIASQGTAPLLPALSIR
jgi:hypothetical protein